VLPNLSEETIKFDEKHFRKAQSQRNTYRNMVYDCILKRYPKITKLKSRKFKLCYRLPKKSGKSVLIIIIIVLKSKRNIIVKTAYNRNVKRKPDC
jgi:hypothetical protein